MADYILEHPNTRYRRVFQFMPAATRMYITTIDKNDGEVIDGGLFSMLRARELWVNHIQGGYGRVQ